MPHTLGLVEQLAYSTIRIECETPQGRSRGTGFFFRFVEIGDKFVPAIVTNKHVVKGATAGYLHFTLSKPDNTPDIGNKMKWSITDGFEKAWISHPDAEIDLCVMPISTLINLAAKQGKIFFFCYFTFHLLPTPASIADFTGLERIVMIGYPNGIWDQKHNFPVFRQGVTAGHYQFDWNGKPEFLIDCACFPGSSGSPVMTCDIGQVLTRRGLQVGANRILLLGILYAGPQHHVDGTVEIVPVPTGDQIVSRSSIPNNLGYVIKASKLHDFDPILREKFSNLSMQE